MAGAVPQASIGDFDLRLGRAGASTTPLGSTHSTDSGEADILRHLVALLTGAIIFPGVKPGDILATLGIGSVAIGFAFEDILQNLLAGLLLVIQSRTSGVTRSRKRLRRNDRADRDPRHAAEDLRRPPRRHPSDICTSPVVVNTAYPQRRVELIVGIGYGDDPAAAMEFFRAAVAGVDGVLNDPPAEALPWALNDSTVDLKLRWWTSSTRGDQVHIKALVILAVAKAAKDHGVDLPFPTSVVLFHDQTEETDGDRKRQREGWPAGDNPPRARAAIKAAPTAAV